MIQVPGTSEVPGTCGLLLLAAYTHLDYNGRGVASQAWILSAVPGTPHAPGLPRSAESEEKMSLSRKMRWQDLTHKQRVAVAIMSVVQVGLLVAALVDMHQRSDEELTASKGTWTAIVFVNFLGPIAYFLFGRRE